MAAVRRAGVTTSTASGTTHAVNIPTSVKLDQVLVVWYRHSDNRATLSRTGWTQADRDTTNTGAIGVLVKKAAAAEVAAAGSTLDFTSDFSGTLFAECTRWSDWHGTTLPEASTTQSYSNAPNPPSISPAWGSADNRAYALCYANGPSGYGANCPDYRAISGAFGRQSASGTWSSFDPDAFSSNTFYWAATTIAIRPGTAGPEVDDFDVAQDPVVLGLSVPTGQATGLDIDVEQDPVVLVLAIGSGQDLDADVQRYIPLVGPTLDEPDRVDEDAAGLDDYVLPVLRRDPGGIPYWYDIDVDLGVAGGSLYIDLTVSGAYTIDRADGETHDLTLTGDATFTLAGALTGEATDLRVLLRQDGTGGRTVTWPGTITWAGGTEPTLQTDPDALDTIGLLSVDDGTSWLGYHVVIDPPVSALDDLSDVTIASPAEGDTLRYRSGEWVNEPWPAAEAAEVLMADGVTFPPDPLYTEDGTDWLYEG